MRKSIYFLIIALFFVSCEKETPKPIAKACFSIDPITDIKIGDTLTFKSCSENSDTYKWIFGDGNTSSDSMTTNIFLEKGSYDVKLIASNDNSTDTTTITVNVRDFTKQELLCSNIWSAYSVAVDNEIVTIPSPDVKYYYFTFKTEGRIKIELSTYDDLQIQEGTWLLSDLILAIKTDGEAENFTINELTTQKLTLKSDNTTFLFKSKK